MTIPTELFAVFHEGNLLGAALTRDIVIGSWKTGPSIGGADSIARVVPGSVVVRFVPEANSRPAGHCRHCGGDGTGKCTHGSHANEAGAFTPWCKGACEFCKPQEVAPSAPSTRDDLLAATAKEVGGAPSCDSAELAEIRARNTKADLTVIPNPSWRQTIEDRRTLLRMVEELTMVTGSQCRRIVELESYANGIATTVDELRAKLTSAESTLNDYATALGATEKKLAQRDRLLSDREAARFALEIKLAETETEAAAHFKAWASAHDDRTTAKLRAEAVEKQVADLIECAAKDNAAWCARAESAEARAAEWEKLHDRLCRHYAKLNEALFAATGGHVDLNKLGVGE